MNVEAVLTDIRERVVRMEEKIDNIKSTRLEDRENTEKDTKAVHARIKRIEDRLFKVAWSLFLTAIGVIVTLVKVAWKGAGQ